MIIILDIYIDITILTNIFGPPGKNHTCSFKLDSNVIITNATKYKSFITRQ